MDDLPIFLQMFVRLFAVFALGAWLQTLAPRKAETPAGAGQPCLVKQAAHPAAIQPAKVCATPLASDPK
jgi:hypothetical protein